MKWVARSVYLSLVLFIPAGLVIGGFFIPIARHTDNIIWTGHHASVSLEVRTILLFIILGSIGTLLLCTIGNWFPLLYKECKWGERTVKK